MARTPRESLKGDPFAYWDDELRRWITSAFRQTPEYQKIEAARNFKDWRHPFMWLMQSSRLHSVAEFLHATHEKNRPDWRRSDKPWAFVFPPVFYMLAGMSFECALKAYLLCSFDAPIADEQLRNVAKGGHDLSLLLAKTRIRHRRDERDTAKELSEFVRWSARYPLPKALAELEESYQRVVHPTSELWDRYEAMHLKFDRRINREVHRYVITGRGRGT